MLEYIKNFSKILLEKTENKKVHVVSHFDTDGITSLAIILKTLKRLGTHFSTKIIKNLTKEEIDLFPKDKKIIILDLGSGCLELLSNFNTKNEIFIIDHHEIDFNSKIKIDNANNYDYKEFNGPDYKEDKNKEVIKLNNLIILNPHLKSLENLCSAELTYLISKEISENNKDLAYLAVLGMIGDIMECQINKIRKQIINEANIKIKAGLLIYPSTRPIEKSLEYSSRPFIPGVSGNPQGVLEILKEAGIEKIGKKYKALVDLNEKEMKALTTAVMLRLQSNISDGKEFPGYIGNLYLIKLFNKIEDAREISAIINACSRMGKSETALLLCLGNYEARKKAERIYIKYKQEIISGLRYIENNHKIQGRDYIIINAKDNIKDTIIGTLASILSFSPSYKEGVMIIIMAYNVDYIKVSARIVGRNSNRNLKEFIDSIVDSLDGGYSGGHKYAAGCTIPIEYEEKFIELVQRKLEYDVIKV